MLDLKFIRENREKVEEAIRQRRMSLSLDGLLEDDARRREVVCRLDNLRKEKNLANQRITRLIKEKKSPQPEIEKMKAVAREIDGWEKEERKLSENIRRLLLAVPNIPHCDAPRGDASRNKVVRAWGEPRRFGFNARSHIELAEGLGLIDFRRGAKVSGANFILFSGLGARLERALFNFMLDLHAGKHGYKEIFPPFLVNRASMTGTGQLPKMAEDMYKLADDDLFLVPTAEVPLTNIFRDETLEEKDLPIYLTAYTACFRREAGSYGKDTRGLMRVHQFDKVELVKFVRPQTSDEELEKLLADAEDVLRLLGLPYRVVMLATGDLSFAAAKCYDLEVYCPGVDRWLEVSSCSNFGDFQARRANIKYKLLTPDSQLRTKYVHTLNGSGVALARTYAAILENYQREDGSIGIPSALAPYMGGRTVLRFP
ncbi:MAG: serine--tRNA ligase [Candidatus Omnitrophota bacterium]